MRMMPAPRELPCRCWRFSPHVSCSCPRGGELRTCLIVLDAVPMFSHRFLRRYLGANVLPGISAASARSPYSGRTDRPAESTEAPTPATIRWRGDRREIVRGGKRRLLRRDIGLTNA